MKTCLLYSLITGCFVAVSIWATDIYDVSLRNPRFFDGWILAGAMIAQLLLHGCRKRWFPLPGSDNARVTFHIYTGVFVIAMFAAHTGNSLPDTLFEWALWVFFVVLVLSGVLGAYLTRAIPHRLDEYGERLVLESIPVMRSELAHQAAKVSLQTQAGSPLISDLYDRVLYNFFNAPRNLWFHLRSSRRPMKQLMFELETVEAELDQNSREVMQEIKSLVEHKNRLDFQYAHEGALKLWLAVHIPATYGLAVLCILHVLSIYAYRSGVE